jgi:2-aminoethylphosphonate-pyruvate transaminase
MTTTLPGRSYFAPPPFSGPEGQEDMPYLLTPGPVTTSRNVKLAMLADYGSRDGEFAAIVADIRKRLLKIAGAGDGYECILMQGPGTFGIEAALGAFAPDRKRKTLVAGNGAYAVRAADILARLGRPHAAMGVDETTPLTSEHVMGMLKIHKTVSHAWLVHCETSSGIVNPVKPIAEALKAQDKIVMLDAMSSFGALPLDLEADGIDVMVSSPNKCLEGVPGFSFVICRRALLEASKGAGHSLTLDLHAQWRAFEETGQFRFTPPTHALVAFQQALRDYDKQGGMAARHARYATNAARLVKGMRALGFKTLLDDGSAGPIIRAFLIPEDTAFDFDQFQRAVRSRGFVVYHGQTSQPAFRIGTIGHIGETVVDGALAAIKAALQAMNVQAAAPAVS